MFFFNNNEIWLLSDDMFGQNTGKKVHKGDIHKPRGQLRVQLNDHFFTFRPYLTNVTTKGREVKNTQNFDHVVYK